MKCQINKKLLTHIEFSIYDSDSTELDSWTYYYDDASIATVTDVTLSNKLQILSDNIYALMTGGGSISLNIHQQDSLTLEGWSSISSGFQLYNRGYTNPANSSYDDYLITQESYGSEIVVTHYQG